MNLFRAELHRLLARRFTQVLLIGILVAFGVTFATTMASTHRPSADEITQAEQQMERERGDRARFYQECVQRLNRGGQANPERIQQVCGPAPTEVRVEQFLDGVFVFTYRIKDLLYFLAAFLGLFAFLVGASYVGAELTSGGMTNLLLWRPRRSAVLGTKLGALLVTMFAASVVAIVVYVGLFWTLAKTGGLVGNLDAAVWDDILHWVGRIVAVAQLGAVLGFAIATVGRHTAAALGVLAGYVVLWEFGGRMVMYMVDVTFPDRWMISSYLAAWMDGDLTLHSQGGCFDGCEPYLLTHIEGGVVLGVLLVAAALVAFTSFRRRDLT